MIERKFTEKIECQCVMFITGDIFDPLKSFIISVILAPPKFYKVFLFQQITPALIIKKNGKYDYVFPVLLGVWFVRRGGHFGADHEQILCLKTKQSFKLSF